MPFTDHTGALVAEDWLADESLHPTTVPADPHTRLAESTYAELGRRVAWDIVMEADDTAAEVAHRFREVRRSIWQTLDRPDAPPSFLERHADHPDPDVRRSVAGHPNAPEHVRSYATIAG